jgi:hypothetical protein
MEQRKAEAVYDSQSISNIESSLSHHRGQGASVEQHIRRLEEVEAHLDSFLQRKQYYQETQVERDANA